MAVTPKLMATGTLLQATLGTLYTVPENTTSQVNEIVFTNHDTVARVVTFNLIDINQTAEDKNEVLDPTGYTLAPGEFRGIGMEQILEAGGFIQAMADSADVVSIRISGVEFT